MELDHVVLEVSDPERSAAFLVEVLGVSAIRLEEFRAGSVKFPSVRVTDSTIIDLFPSSMWRGPAPRNPNHLCFATSTEELARVRARLTARAVPLARVDDHNFGARGFGRSVYFDDPDGISIEVRDYP